MPQDFKYGYLETSRKNALGKKLEKQRRKSFEENKKSLQKRGLLNKATYPEFKPVKFKLKKKDRKAKSKAMRGFI